MNTTTRQTTKPNTGRAVAQVLLAGVGWGIIGLFTRRLAAAGLTPVQIAGVRAFVTSLFMVGLLLVRDPAALRIRLRDLWMFLGTGIASVLFFNVCSFMAIELTGLSVASILLYTAPGIVTLLSAVLFRHRITRRKVLAVGLSFLGCALVSGLADGGLTITPLGLLAGLGSGFGYALYTIFSNVALRRYKPYTVTTWTFLLALAGALPICRPWEIAAVMAAQPEAIGVGVLLGLCSTTLPFLLYTDALTVLEPSRASLLATAEPIVATLAGVVVYHESLTGGGVLGVVLMVAAIAMLR